MDEYLTDAQNAKVWAATVSRENAHNGHEAQSQEMNEYHWFLHSGFWKTCVLHYYTRNRSSTNRRS